MIFALVMAIACTGQVCYDTPVYCQPVYVESCLAATTPTITSRFNVTIVYRDGIYRTVPIINGYAPRIVTECVNGSLRVVYDYRGRIPYKQEWQAGWRASTSMKTTPRPSTSKPTLAPRSEPTPRILPRPEPPKPAPRLETRPLVPVPSSPLPPVPDPGLRNPRDLGDPRIRLIPSYKGE